MNNDQVNKWVKPHNAPSVDELQKRIDELIIYRDKWKRPAMGLGKTIARLTSGGTEQ